MTTKGMDQPSWRVESEQFRFMSQFFRGASEMWTPHAGWSAVSMSCIEPLLPRMHTRTVRPWQKNGIGLWGTAATNWRIIWPRLTPNKAKRLYASPGLTRRSQCRSRTKSASGARFATDLIDGDHRPALVVQRLSLGRRKLPGMAVNDFEGEWNHAVGIALRIKCVE